MQPLTLSYSPYSFNSMWSNAAPKMTNKVISSSESCYQLLLFMSNKLIVFTVKILFAVRSPYQLWFEITALLTPCLTVLLHFGTDTSGRCFIVFLKFSLNFLLLYYLEIKTGNSLAGVSFVSSHTCLSTSAESCVAFQLQAI